MLKTLVLSAAALFLATSCANPGVPAAPATPVPPVVPPAPPLVIKVMTWNIHHGQGMDGKIDLQRIAEVIRKVKPDIAVLQEVDVNVTRSGGVDQAKVLAEATGLTPCFAKAMALQGGEYGNLLLSRVPVRGYYAVSLQPPGTSEPRSIVDADLQLREDVAVKVLGTHFDVNPQATWVNAETIVKSYQNIDPAFGILAGDLNAGPESDPLVRLTRKIWTRMAPAPDQGTCPADQPKETIDHILVRPAMNWKLLSSEVLPETVASDHRPVVAVLEFRNVKVNPLNPSAPMPAAK